MDEKSKPFIVAFIFHIILSIMPNDGLCFPHDYKGYWTYKIGSSIQSIEMIFEHPSVTDWRITEVGNLTCSPRLNLYLIDNISPYKTVSNTNDFIFFRKMKLYILDDEWHLQIIPVKRNFDISLFRNHAHYEYHEIVYEYFDSNDTPTGEEEIHRFYCLRSKTSNGIELFHVFHDHPDFPDLYIESIFTEKFWHFRNKILKEPERDWWDVDYGMLKHHSGDIY